MLLPNKNAPNTCSWKLKTNGKHKIGRFLHSGLLFVNLVWISRLEIGANVLTVLLKIDSKSYWIFDGSEQNRSELTQCAQLRVRSWTKTKDPSLKFLMGERFVIYEQTYFPFVFVDEEQRRLLGKEAHIWRWHCFHSAKLPQYLGHTFVHVKGALVIL